MTDLRDTGLTGPFRCGTLAWGLTTSGKLSRDERRSFLAPALGQTLRYIVGRMQLLLGLRSKNAIYIELDELHLPDSRLAKEAEAEARAQLSPEVVNHSFRTFLFGLALAEVDQISVDLEQLYAGALLHDISLEAPEASTCFAVRGAQEAMALAQRVGADELTTRLIAEAISMHVTPGLDYFRDPLAALLQFGAMVDLTGQRAWQLQARYVKSVLERYPRLQLKRKLAAAWKAEAKTFPEGRAAYLERVFLFSLLLRMAPFRDG